MSFPELKPATLLDRLNRFVAKVLYEGKELTAYIRNTGRLSELLFRGNRVYVKERTLGKHPLEIVLASYDNHLVCIDSHIAPKLYAELIGSPVVFEPTFGDRRFDLLIDGRPVEVKSVNLVKEDVALFPDAPTKRGKEHILKLIELSKEGYRPLLVFVVQREDCKLFSPNWEVDGDFSQALELYINMGLEARAYRCRVNLKEIRIEVEIPLVVRGQSLYSHR
ncbi:MAG: DNA/RNA nuclease SfsA [Acidobacteria bacterium]|jgi:sugar fermentation stimulation protein A|nr:MAG: DNA/RNA nuclease SfsA [Acidobacteriota bacterium]